MVGMQISLSLVGLLNDTSGRSPVDAFVQSLAALRDEGFRRVWLAQLPYDPDLTTLLAVALREVDTIEVGSGVIPIQVQHPTQLAQRALTLNVISGGRFTLGIGMSHRMVAEQMWGVSWDKAVRQMREYLDGLLPLLEGRPAEAEGEFWTTRAALQMPGAPTPDVYLAALGPQMLRLAGRRTAGTLTWMTGPKTLAEHIGPALREAAAEAGRSESDGECRGVVTGERHRRRRRRTQAGRRGVRDLRAAAVLPRDAGPRRLCRTRGRGDHRRRGHRVRPAR